MKQLPLLLICLLFFCCAPDTDKVDREAYALLSEFAETRYAENTNLINSFCNDLESRRPANNSAIDFCKKLWQLTALLEAFNQHTQNLNFAKDDLDSAITLYQASVQQINQIYRRHAADTVPALLPLNVADDYDRREALLILMRTDLIWKMDKACSGLFNKVSHDPIRFLN